MPRLTPAELVEELRELGRAGYADTFPDIPLDETIEFDAAAFIEAAARFLGELVAADGPLAGQANEILKRLQ